MLGRRVSEVPAMETLTWARAQLWVQHLTGELDAPHSDSVGPWPRFLHGRP